MPIKRRKFLSLGLGSFATAAVGQYYLTPAQGSLAANEIAPVNSQANHPPYFRFIAIGDFGTGEPEQYAVAQTMLQQWHSVPFSLALTTGDNIYPNGEIEKIAAVFERPYADLLQNGVKFYASLGNHDVRTNQGADQIAYAGYNMKGRYYTFREQTVQFFALDTNQKCNLSGRMRESSWENQLQWLRTELEKSTAPWKIVFAHHPVYSSGAHGSDDALADALAPLFATYGVQLYVNGHDHNYERTKQINGTTYITSGNGAKLRPVEASSYSAHASAQLGFTAFNVYLDRIVVQAINTDSNVYDEVHILQA
ncbi:MAG: metallophosphoesterase [Phormidesmis sp.]